MSLGCVWRFERFDWMWSGSYLFFFNPATPSPRSMSGHRVWVIRWLFEAQDCRFFVFVPIRLADVLLSPEPGGDQDTLFAHNNVARGYTGLRVIFCLFLYLFYFFD